MDNLRAHVDWNEESVIRAALRWWRPPLACFTWSSICQDTAPTTRFSRRMGSGSLATLCPGQSVRFDVLGARPVGQSEKKTVKE